MAGNTGRKPHSTASPDELRAAGKLLRHARTRRGRPQTELAASVGESARTISRWENGNRAPSSGQLHRVVEELQIDHATWSCLARYYGHDNARAIAGDATNEQPEQTGRDHHRPHESGSESGSGRATHGRAVAVVALGVAVAALVSVLALAARDDESAATSTAPPSAPQASEVSPTAQQPQSTSASTTATSPAASDSTTTEPVLTGGTAQDTQPASTAAGELPDGISTPPAPCSLPPGAAAVDLDRTAKDRLAELADRFDALIDDSECTASAVRWYGQSLVQDVVDSAGRPAGVVLVAPEAQPLRLNSVQWSSYLEMAGKSGPDNAANFGGYPLTIAESPDGIVIALTGGGALVGVRPNLPHFWVPSIADVHDLWTAMGGLTGALGAPTSNPYLVDGEWRLDFTHGYLRSPASGAIVPEAVFVDAPGAELAAFGELQGRILRQAGGQAWYVDEDKVAHWIPDGAVWACLRGDEVKLQSDIAGYAVWSLEIGDTAACP